MRPRLYFEALHLHIKLEGLKAEIMSQMAEKASRINMRDVYQINDTLKEYQIEEREIDQWVWQNNLKHAEQVQIEFVPHSIL